MLAHDPWTGLGWAHDPWTGLGWAGRSPDEQAGGFHCYVCLQVGELLLVSCVVLCCVLLCCVVLWCVALAHEPLNLKPLNLNSDVDLHVSMFISRLGFARASDSVESDVVRQHQANHHFGRGDQ